MTAMPGPSGKRLAVVTTSYPSDADDIAGHFVRAEVRQQLAAGHEVTVFAPRALRSSEFQERVIGIPHAGAFGSPGVLARVRWHPERCLGVGAYLLLARRRLFAAGDFDEITAHFLLPSYWPVATGHPRLTRVVVHGSDLRLLERLPSALRGRVLARLGGDRPAIQCVSQELADRLNTLTRGQLERRIYVQPSPVDLPRIAEKRELRRTLSLDHRTLIVIVARLIASKRVEVALKAALRLPNAQIVVCGGGPLHRRLSRAYPSVRFLGQIPRAEALTWIAAADVLLSASRHEGASTAIREARALGTPVVTTASGDLLAWAASDPGLHVVP